jgi:hypothetical protein
MVLAALAEDDEATGAQAPYQVLQDWNASFTMAAIC